ncbi:B12-binding domain-containing radical SAM protein [Salinactinospora qingdaonensis]|uniref:B12-binding domain-containing protein n=1 Tax=Salinactinospora qingdaonensis TaxID=702744 RepID=A0ABP7GMJ3_9ACTN
MTSTAPATDHDRILAALNHLSPLPTHLAHQVHAIPRTEPNRLRHALAPAFETTVTGTLEHRLLAARPHGCDTWILSELSGRHLAERDWPAWAHTGITLDAPYHWMSTAHLTPEAHRRLTKPRILLAALYHPEHFPLPRFPLAISDLARAARASLCGQVDLMDMQLGASLADICAAITTGGYDLVGVSATFGQHDLLTRALDHTFALTEPPTVIAGGSLTARNEALLLQRYPHLLIARGAGEPTITDLITWHHGDLALKEIRGLGYAGAPRGGALAITRPSVRRTPTVANRHQPDMLPELDLLAATLDHHGVAQLETSRGCTNYCSFCPRGHKGMWSSLSPQSLPWMLEEISAVFDRHPGTARTLYLVDEEIIGHGPDSLTRIRDIANQLHQAGMTWDSSCRIDQVVDPGHDRAWHLERAQLWRDLCGQGLRRMLFGVESGVTSVLARFNKETTGEQNALAIRTLSALGVPTRYTYITFDHLMSVEELAATHAFQARTDLLLRPLPHLPVETIIEGVRDESFVAEHSTGRPFYTAVSYMLVSMECLIGAAYTRRVEAAGLAGHPRPSLGRIDADFADWRIGVCSQLAQLWIDRNFALDYTLKSIEKILEGEARHQVRHTRSLLKDAAFALLGSMLEHIAHTRRAEPSHKDLTQQLQGRMDDGLAKLQCRLAYALPALADQLPAQHARILREGYDRWRAPHPWRLINAADPCGT